MNKGLDNDDIDLINPDLALNFSPPVILSWDFNRNPMASNYIIYPEEPNRNFKIHTDYRSSISLSGNFFIIT